MTLVSSVPRLTFTEAGLVLPQEVDILAGVQADMDSAFGGGLNDALETPQGQLASSQTAIIGDKNNEFAYFVNQVDPQYASGRFQDAIARIYFLTRKPATPTTVQATITGLPGAIIPAGALAQDTSGNTYILSGNVTIGQGGTAVAEFQNVENGPIPCAAGTLTQVYQAIPGWDAINNVTAGAIGGNEESRADFEYRRRNSVFINANGSPGAIYASVFNVSDVVDCYVLDNPSGETVYKGATNYPLLPHSVYVAAVGGTDAEVAQAIWRKKDVGCDYNGNTTVVVTDQSGYNYPYPAYNVTFQRPNPVAIKFAVTVVNNPSLPANVVDLIRADIFARFSGLDGSARERIGANIFASRYYCAISSVSSILSIISIFVGIDSPTLPSVEVGIDQYPTLNLDDIAVTLV